MHAYLFHLKLSRRRPCSHVSSPEH